MVAVSSPSASSTTASGLPAKRRVVNTSSVVKRRLITVPPIILARQLPTGEQAHAPRSNAAHSFVSARNMPPSGTRERSAIAWVATDSNYHADDLAWIKNGSSIMAKTSKILALVLIAGSAAWLAGPAAAAPLSQPSSLQNAITSSVETVQFRRWGG